MSPANGNPTAKNGLLFDEPFLRKLERLALLSRQAMVGRQQGDRRSSKRGQSVEFADFRPYVSGDDFRRIDWNAYARLERFFIKLFIEEEDLTVHFLIDNSSSMDWGETNKLDYSIRAAGAIGYVVLVGLDRVAVSTLDKKPETKGKNHLRPLRGKNQAVNLFSFLQSIPVTARFPSGRILDSQLNKFAAMTRPVGPLLIFSDLMDDGWQPGINRLVSHGFEVTIFHILSADEIEPNLDGDFKLIDRESTASVEITADFDTIEQYRQRLVEWRTNWRHFCRARGIQYLPISTDFDLEKLLFAHLQKQGVLR